MGAYQRTIRTLQARLDAAEASTFPRDESDAESQQAEPQQPQPQQQEQPQQQPPPLGRRRQPQPTPPQRQQLREDFEGAARTDNISPRVSPRDSFLAFPPISGRVAGGSSPQRREYYTVWGDSTREACGLKS